MTPEEHRRYEMWWNMKSSKLAVLSATFIVWCGNAHAGAAQPFSDDLFLDWDGIRSALYNDGIDFRLGYVSETATNVQGGPEELWRYTDQWTFAATFDLQKIFGLNQAQFKITVTDRNGQNLSAKLDTLQLVQEVYGRGQTWRWTQFFYDQKYLDGMVDWKVGRLTEGEDFAAFSCQFQNLTFCGAPPGNLVGNYWYNWPVSQWATRVKISLAGFGYVQLGAFEVDPSYLLTRYALDIGSPPGATGVLVPFEVGWLPTFFSHFNGSYKFGAWYNSSKEPDVVDNTNGLPLAIAGGQPLMRHGAYGAYVNFQQRLSAPEGAPKQGLSVFFNATYADRRTATLDNQFAAGLFYAGPFAARPEDEIGFALGRTHVNSRVTNVETSQNNLGLGPVGVQNSEWVSEIYYNVHAAPWLDLRPNIQYVRHPGGIDANTDDVITGLKLAINF
jgi:porin